MRSACLILLDPETVTMEKLQCDNVECVRVCFSFWIIVSFICFIVFQCCKMHQTRYDEMCQAVNRAGCYLCLICSGLQQETNDFKFLKRHPSL